MKHPRKLALLALGGVLLMAGCIPSDQDWINQNGLQVVVYDKCQYVRWDRSLTHKGNCTNLVHGIMAPRHGGVWRYEPPEPESVTRKFYPSRTGSELPEKP